MTYKENITAILECYFTGFKEEIIDSACNRILEQQPPITPKEKTGKWIDEKWHVLDLIGVTCSNCNVVESRFSAYCPNCGARMVKSQESEDKEEINARNG